jgi:hypothetical protein
VLASGQRLARRGTGASSGGTDPDSVTIAGDNVVYALNAGSKTIAGFRLSPGRLAPIPGAGSDVNAWRSRCGRIRTTAYGAA